MSCSVITDIQVMVKKNKKYYRVFWDDGTSYDYPYNQYSVNIHYSVNPVVPFTPNPHKGCSGKVYNN